MRGLNIGVDRGPPVPRYYIDLQDGQARRSDDDGSVFEGADAARREAIKALTLMVNDALPDGDDRDFSVQIWGEPVYEAHLSFKGSWIGRVA